MRGEGRENGGGGKEGEEGEKQRATSQKGSRERRGESLHHSSPKDAARHIISSFETCPMSKAQIWHTTAAKCRSVPKSPSLFES